MVAGGGDLWCEYFVEVAVGDDDVGWTDVGDVV